MATSKKTKTKRRISRARLLVEAFERAGAPNLKTLAAFAEAGGVSLSYVEKLIRADRPLAPAFVAKVADRCALPRQVCRALFLWVRRLPASEGTS